MKKIIALLLAAAMLVAFAACNKNSGEDTTTTTLSESDNVSETQAAETTVADLTTEPASENTTVDSSETTAAAETTTVAPSDDPSKWTDEEIIAFYKAAATKTHPKVQHSQTMTMDSLVIGEGGGVGGFVLDKVAVPAINAVLQKNSATFDGITGGYKDLVASDAKSIKAYKSGNYTVIEMTMKDQTDGKHGHNMSGTVGHAITVLGDVSVAVAEFPQFEIDTENADIKIHYNNATVKVKINQNGMIEKGTWDYTASVSIKNLDISGLMVKKASADIGYNIVLGGGF